MANDRYESGDVDIKTLSITPMSTGKHQGILPQVLSLSLYEDLLAPTLYCEVLINDAVGLLKTLPIVGNEWLDIEFLTPGRTSYKARFHVYKIEDYQADALQQKAVYKLKC